MNLRHVVYRMYELNVFIIHRVTIYVLYEKR